MEKVSWISRLPENYKKITNREGESYFAHELASIVGNVFIGKYTYLHGRIRINTTNSIIIGKYCSIATDVRIVGDDHDYKRISTYPFKTILGLDIKYNEAFGKDVTISNDVWIGESVMILPGTVINNGVVIGAGSVVKGNLLPYGIYVGNPAKLIKKRFPDYIIEFLQDLKWWDWTDEKILNNSFFFSQDLSQTTIEQIKSHINN